MDWDALPGDVANHLSDIEQALDRVTTGLDAGNADPEALADTLEEIAELVKVSIKDLRASL